MRYKVVINEPKPYLHFDDHKVKYAGYKGAKGKQVVIRDSKEPKYYVVKGHPGNAKGHYKAKGGNGNNGKGKGNKKGNYDQHTNNSKRSLKSMERHLFL